MQESFLYIVLVHNEPKIIVEQVSIGLIFPKLCAERCNKGLLIGFTIFLHYFARFLVLHGSNRIIPLSLSHLYSELHLLLLSLFIDSQTATLRWSSKWTSGVVDLSVTLMNGLHLNFHFGQFSCTLILLSLIDFLLRILQRTFN